MLPKHCRCAAHTFNLMAASDADKALKDSVTDAMALWLERTLCS